MPVEASSSTSDMPYTAPNGQDNVFDNGAFRIEHDNYYIACKGRPIQLPRKEFLILSRLARNPDRIVSSEEIWRHAWGHQAPFNSESLHVHIYRLRRRLEPFGVHIETMVNVGYRLSFSNGNYPTVTSDK